MQANTYRLKIEVKLGFDPPKEAAITQPNSTTSTWTDERIEKLKAFHANGISFARIAALIGGLSRNAVIGKAGRLGLTHRGKGYRGPAAKQSKPAPLKLVTIKRCLTPKVIKAEARCEELPSLKLSFDELQSGDCRYPEGDGPTFTFCGRPTLEKSSYCGFYHNACWVAPIPSKRQVAA